MFRDLFNWAEASTPAQNLYWDDGGGDAIVLNGKEFKVLSVKIDLDRFECQYTAREIV